MSSKPSDHPKKTPITRGKLLPTVGVHFLSYNDPTDQMHAAYNPTELKYALQANIGKLHPIGSPSPTLQYGNTDSLEIPLTLEYTALKMRELGLYTDLMQPIRWFMSHVVAYDKGLSPDPVVFVWPHIMTIDAIITRVDVTHKEFDTLMNPIAYTINISMMELRRNYLYANEAQLPEWLTMRSGNDVRQLDKRGTAASVTGRRLRLGGK
jgi:hypothetical protein